jgi:hypothetical protein
MRCGRLWERETFLPMRMHEQYRWYVWMQGWDGSEDHVMLLLLAALGALRAL